MKIKDHEVVNSLLNLLEDIDIALSKENNSKIRKAIVTIIEAVDYYDLKEDVKLFEDICEAVRSYRARVVEELNRLGVEE